MAGNNANVNQMVYDYLMERANDYYREYCAAVAAKSNADGDTPTEDDLKTAILAYGIMTGEALHYYVNHMDAFDRNDNKKMVVRDNGDGTVYMAEENAD